LRVVTEEAVRMSDSKLFHAVGPVTQNARLRRRRLVRGTTRSPRAAERRAARVFCLRAFSVPDNNSDQVVHIHMPLSLSCRIWYWPKGSVTQWLPITRLKSPTHWLPWNWLQPQSCMRLPLSF